MERERIPLIRPKVIDWAEFESQISVIQIDLEGIKIVSWLNET